MYGTANLDFVASTVLGLFIIKMSSSSSSDFGRSLRDRLKGAKRRKRSVTFRDEQDEDDRDETNLDEDSDNDGGSRGHFHNTYFDDDVDDDWADSRQKKGKVKTKKPRKFTAIPDFESLLPGASTRADDSDELFRKLGIVLPSSAPDRGSRSSSDDESYDDEDVARDTPVSVKIEEEEEDSSDDEGPVDRQLFDGPPDVREQGSDEETDSGKKKPTEKPAETPTEAVQKFVSCWACREATFSDYHGSRFMILENLIRRLLGTMTIDCIVGGVHAFYELKIRHADENKDEGEWSPAQIKVHLFDHMFDIGLEIFKQLEEFRKVRLLCRGIICQVGDDGSVLVDAKAASMWLKINEAIVKLMKTQTHLSVNYNQSLTPVNSVRVSTNSGMGGRLN